MTTPEAPRRSSKLRDRFGPVALVTGASDGIGRALAEALAAEGFGLILVARRADALAGVAAGLAARHGVMAEVVAADLGTEAGVAAAIAAADGRDVGLLVAAAGFGAAGPLVDAELAPELDMLRVNCAAVLALAHCFGGRFARRGRGGIVLMSSLLAFQGVPGAANYAATKAYVQSLAEGLRVELGPRGVAVIAAAPGPVRSGFAARAGMRMGLAGTPEAVARETLAALGRRTTVRPGWLSKALEASLALLPRAGRTRVLARVMAGMTDR
jgi:hypothetical protein